MKKTTPSVFQILAKTARLTIFLNAPVSATIGDLKEQALPALEQYASSMGESTNNTEAEDDVPLPDLAAAASRGRVDVVPKVNSAAQFEFCSARRDRAGRVVEYNVLDSKAVVRESLSNWEVVYFRFRDEETGKLLDVHVEEPVDPDEVDSVPDTKGKRKEHPT